MINLILLQKRSASNFASSQRQGKGSRIMKSEGLGEEVIAGLIPVKTYVERDLQDACVSQTWTTVLLQRLPRSPASEI